MMALLVPWWWDPVLQCVTFEGGYSFDWDGLCQWATQPLPPDLPASCTSAELQWAKLTQFRLSVMRNIENTRGTTDRYCLFLAFQGRNARTRDGPADWATDLQLSQARPTTTGAGGNDEEADALEQEASDLVERYRAEARADEEVTPAQAAAEARALKAVQDSVDSVAKVLQSGGLSVDTSKQRLPNVWNPPTEDF